MSLPVVTNELINACKNTNELLEKIPPRCVCVNAAAYKNLQKRYKEVGISYNLKKGTLEINS